MYQHPYSSRAQLLQFEMTWVRVGTVVQRLVPSVSLGTRIPQNGKRDGWHEMSLKGAVSLGISISCGIHFAFQGRT